MRIETNRPLTLAAFLRPGRGRHGAAFCCLLLLTTASGTAQDTGLPRAAELFRTGKLAEAEDVLRQVVKASPREPAAWNLLGAVLDERKQYGEAEAAFRKALALAPGSAGIWNNFGNHCLAAHKADDALAAFRKVVAIDTAHQNANLQMARLLLDRKQGKEALTHLSVLKAPASDAPAVKLLRARALAQAGQKNDAAALLADVERNSAGPGAWYSIGLARVEMADFAAAEEAFSRALEAEPGNRDILQNLGLAALRAGHAPRAQQVFEAILRGSPDDPEALFQLGRAVSAQARYDEAILVLAKARRLAPQRADILKFLAGTEAQAGFFGDAALAYDEYLKLRPDDEIARRDRGFVYSCAGNKAVALPELERYVSRHPNDPEGHFQYGFALSVADTEKALRHLNEAIRLKPDFPEAYLARGAVYRLEGKTEQALPDLEYAVAHRPDHIRALTLLGQLYAALDRPRDAARVLRHGYELSPTDPQILMTLGRALRDIGETAEGDRILQEFAKAGPDRSSRRALPGSFDLLLVPPGESRKRYEANLRTHLGSRSGDPKVRSELARFLLANGRRGEALKEFEQILAADAAPPVMAECGHALIDSAEYELARRFLERAVAAQPDAATQLDYAMALAGAGDPASAVKALDQMNDKDRQGDYYLLRAQVLDALGRVKDAVDSLNLGFQKSPTRPDLYESATQFLLKHRMDAEALKLVEQATALLPDDADLLLWKAMVLGIRNKTEDAIVVLKKISSRWPEWSRPYLVRGIIEENHSNSADAEKSIRTAIAMGERTPEAYFYLAQAQYHLDPENSKPALEAIRKSIELDPSDPWAQALAGRLAWQYGGFDESIRHLKEAIRLKKDFARAHLWLSATYRSMGKPGEADAEAAEVARIHERNPQAEAEEAAGTRERLFPLR